MKAFATAIGCYMRLLLGDKYLTSFFLLIPFPFFWKPAFLILFDHGVKINRRLEQYYLKRSLDIWCSDLFSLTI